MGGRIITMQRQARELGRLRTGFSRPHADPNKRPVPVKSKTWVLTSHAEHYIAAAAQAWGGTVERWQPQGNGAPQFRVITERESIDALLPSGDPLSQNNEMWNAGGCVRRCNGEFEQITRRPCVCLADFGEDWHQQPKGKVCATTSRLNVILPDMPDLGLWRAESHSFYAANEWSGTVDLARAGTGGKGMLPVALRIEPRTRVAGGKTKHFPVVVVEIRGITPRQALSGPLPTAVALDPSTAPQLLAIEAAPAPDYAAKARMCRTPDEVFALWKQVQATDNPRATKELWLSLKAISEDIGRGVDPSVPEADESGDEVLEPEFVDPEDPDDMWGQFDAAGLALGLSPEDAARGFEEKHQIHPRKAKAALVWEYIAALRKQRDEAVA